MRDVEGWLFEPEAGLLMATAALALTQSEPHAVVEVGSYCGRSTVILGNAVSAVCPGAKVYAIDPHEGEITCGGGLTTTRAASTLSKFMENIAAAGLSDAVQLIQKRSFDVAWQQPISLLFIDALHDYANVSCDFAHFAPWLVDGGYIVFDDYDPSFPGVVRFVDELCSSSQYRKVQQVGRMVALRNEASRISGSRQGVQSNPSAGRGTSTGESQARGGAGASATGMDVSDESSRVDLPLLQDRVSRQERALATLWGIVGEETARREQMLADLTGQLQATVAGRDRLVSDRDALITDLQAAVTERDRAISDLQAQLSAARETVTRMQDVPVQLQAAVTERDRAISDLQAQLSAARETVTRMQLARVWHLTALYDRVRRWPKSWWLARRL
jgi:predicted O-methyltransferase YrrM/uncharacterized coiled-coil protein SlyX